MPLVAQSIEPGYANVSVYGVAGVSGLGGGVGGVGGVGAHWRAVLAREEHVYESAGDAAAGPGGAAAAYWWWRVQACRRHARAHAPLDLCTMPRVGRGRGGRGGVGAGAGAGGAARGLELRDALSASCGSIADVAGAGGAGSGSGAGGAAPCLLVLHAPRPSCSYHVLPESHRAPRRARPGPVPHACCEDGARDTARERDVTAPPPHPAHPAHPPPPRSDTDDSDAEGS